MSRLREDSPTLAGEFSEFLKKTDSHAKNCDTWNLKIPSSQPNYLSAVEQDKRDFTTTTTNKNKWIIDNELMSVHKPPRSRKHKPRKLEESPKSKWTLTTVLWFISSTVIGVILLAHILDHIFSSVEDEVEADV